MVIGWIVLGFCLVAALLVVCACIAAGRVDAWATADLDAVNVERIMRGLREAADMAEPDAVSAVNAELQARALEQQAAWAKLSRERGR